MNDFLQQRERREIMGPVNHLCRKKKIPRFLLLCALCGVLFLLFAPKKKGGFSIEKVRSPLQVSPKWAIDPLNEKEKGNLEEIFAQSFNYLGSGAQCYAFLSADGKYVLKFFKMKHLLPKQWLKLLPIPGLGKYRFNKIDKRILRQKGLFASYKMAFEELREETGLVYIHLNKSRDLNMCVTLYDRMRKPYHLDLDQFEFVLQKKAQLIRDRIELLVQRGDEEGAVDAIGNLLLHVVNQCKRGFIDGDSGISHNYGFIGSQVIHFDVGRISKDEQAKEPSYYQREVLRVGKKLEDWLEIYHPFLLPALEEEINQRI